MKLSIDQLKAFAAAAHFESFSKAARSMGKAQSVISSYIQALEDELDFKLFYRGHNVKLTPRGKVLLEHINDILVDAKAFEMRALALHDTKSPIINFGIDDSIYTKKLFTCLKDFAIKNPQVELKITSISSFDTPELLENSSIDLALYFTHHSPANFNYQSIGKVVNTLIVKKGHPLTKINNLKHSDLINFRQIVVCSQSEKSLDPITFSPLKWEVDDFYYALSLVVEGVGFAVVPKVLIDIEGEFLSNIQILDDTNLNFSDSYLSLAWSHTDITIDILDDLKNSLFSAFKSGLS